MNITDYQELKFVEAANNSGVAISIIKEIEESSNLNKYQIALLSNISLKTVYRICSGQVSNPSFSTFKKLFGTYCLFCCEPNQNLAIHVKQMFFEEQTSIQRLPL